MAFHKIDVATWERRSHYEAYTTFLPLNWNVTVELELTQLLPAVKARGLRLYPVMLWLAATAVRQNRAFCMGYDDNGALGYYDEVNPSYTVFHEDDKTFSDMWSFYDAHFPVFYGRVVHDMAEWGDQKGYKARPDAPENCCPMSMTPWLRFTNCSFDTFKPSLMLRPVLTFGQYFERNGGIYMPFSIFSSHAVADGWHASCLVRDLQSLTDLPEQWMDA